LETEQNVLKILIPKRLKNSDRFSSGDGRLLRRRKWKRGAARFRHRLRDSSFEQI